MSAFHVVVRPRPDCSPSPALAPLYGLFDVVVDGINVTARIADGCALSLLADMAHAVAGLTSGRSPRGTVQLYADEDVWELGLERDGDDVLVTVFRTGPTPEVAVHERRVTLVALRAGLVAALAEAPRAPTTAEATLSGLRAGQAALESTWPPTARPAAGRVRATVTTAPHGGLSIAATANFRRGPSKRAPEKRGTLVERADLHALLAVGDLTITARDRTVTIPGCFPFLVAERLVGLAEEAFDAWETGRAIFRRIIVGEHRLGVRRGPGDGPFDVTIGAGFGTADTRSLTFPAIHATDFAAVAHSFARRLGEVLTAHDSSHEHNLRLKCLLTTAERLGSRAQASTEDDSVTNPEPDSYRSFAPRRRPTSAGSGPWSHGGRMRFLPRWVATVPGVDLKSTFLCGDRIVVGASREMACLDRGTGAVLWRAPTGRGGSVSTPTGIARLEPDGKICMRDLETGEIRFAARITPRAAGGATGAVVCTPGLPRLLVVAEGERTITALDLVTGEVRWRHTGPRPAAYRMRRAGKLLLASGGDSALVALDVASGDVVWRFRDRAPFAPIMTLDHDSAFLTSGAPGGRHRLHHVDAWTGEVRYSVQLDEAPLGTQAPLVAGDVVAVPVRDANGTGVHAFRRSDGHKLWEHPPGLVAPLCAWLVVDDTLLANTGAGVLLCLDAKTGEVRYSHVFAGTADADQPRRLEPVLRSGALFVPQHQVYVVRPNDGEIIGTVPCDLIPDLLRVDELCSVYLGEESGHLAAFGAAPRLTLVR